MTPLFRRRGIRHALLAAVLALLLTSCSTNAPAGDRRDAAPAHTGAGPIRPPAAHAPFDYQLGGAYPPPDGVRALSRDRSADPAPGLYNICYVNAFQTQPGDAVDWWRAHHPGLLLRDARGGLVIDEDWDEPLLDISTPGTREALLDIVGPWIDGCAKAGFDAVEPDNLDSYERSDGRLTADDAAAFATLLARRAHDRGLAIAQKNTTALLDRRRHIGFDFAVVEECARYRECPAFADAYDGKVFDIEYTAKDFDGACRRWGERLSLTLRDRDVRPAAEPGHVSRRC
ncbi:MULTISPECIES: endo alpha-1,4 polygalactosaminidase [Streptomyces]|uniref:endo alpha-1,4 polygalactosaminidase n=1 Tax=Streptomyces TaxID=1883 RepID=UPI00069B5EDC|nr:endo alpha-1,4 polygalactosaminidase [Streptomyces sp. SID7805]MYU56667.1 hypothetical protein [Streptomyces sp. SID7805]